MKVAVIGTGRMGRGFTSALSADHDVLVGSRDPASALRRVNALGAADVVTYRQAARRARVVVLTVPWEAHAETVAQTGDLRGKVVVDTSFPRTKADREQLLRRRSSSAEELQRMIPDARVFKGWSHVHAPYLTDPEVNGIAQSVLIAGDDSRGKRVVFGLARDMGFHPVDAGPLSACRDIDRLVGAMLFVRLGPIRVLSQ